MDVVTLGAALKGAKSYTDSTIAPLMGGVHWKGRVNYYDDLPSNPSVGDAYTVKYAGSSGTVADGTEYVWGYDNDLDAYAWIDFSKDCYTKAQTDILLSGKGSIGAIAAVANRGAKNFLQKPESVSSQSPTKVSAVVNADDSITVTVTETLSSAVLVYYDVELPDGTYIFSCGANSGTGEGDSYDCFIWDTTAGATIIRDNDDAEPFSEATIPAGTYQLRIRMRIGASAGTYIFKPMLRDARIADDEYIPPAMSNAELTAIVGNKNYIDVNGVRFYISSTAPTGDIPDGSVGIGW